MKILLSPAKSLDFSTPIGPHHTLPQFVCHSVEINQTLRQYSPAELMKLMDISDQLAQLNYQRNQDFTPDFTPENARCAIMAFNGDVYEGLSANTFSDAAMDFAQKHLCILSGLYGMLRPLDLIQPYRLEMGTKMAVANKKNLYDYWGEILTTHLQNQLKEGEAVINLASEEYAKVIRMKELKNQVITPIFKDYKNGVLKIISFYAKFARGKMAHFIITNQLTNPDDLKSFSLEGYAYAQEYSSNHQWVFVR